MKNKQTQIQYHRMGSFLIDNKIIYEIRYYVDRKKLWHQYYHLVDHKHECDLMLYTLLEILCSPICLDRIEGKLSNHRKQVRGMVYSIDKNLFHFYESNKLNSSTFGNVFTLVDFILESGYQIKPQLLVKMNEIKHDLSGGSEIPVERYKNHLDNAGRLLVVYKLQDFLEEFIHDVFMQINEELI